MTTPIQASNLAAAVAEQAVTAEHGDNNPRATLDLELRFGIGGLVDQKEARVVAPAAGQPMFRAWDRQGGEPS